MTPSWTLETPGPLIYEAEPLRSVNKPDVMAGTPASPVPSEPFLAPEAQLPCRSLTLCVPPIKQSPSGGTS